MTPELPLGIKSDIKPWRLIIKEGDSQAIFEAGKESRRSANYNIVDATDSRRHEQLRMTLIGFGKRRR